MGLLIAGAGALNRKLLMCFGGALSSAPPFDILGEQTGLAIFLA
jgi:hypothetical protein